jgi:hypothetical protein
VLVQLYSDPSHEFGSLVVSSNSVNYCRTQEPQAPAECYIEKLFHVRFFRWLAAAC